MHTIDSFHNAELIIIDKPLLETFKTLNRLFNKKSTHKKILTKTNFTINTLSGIKTIINKTTLETYNENCNDLIQQYNEFSEKEECAIFIFNILSKNSFYSSLYASLYTRLINIDGHFLTVLNNNKSKLHEQYGSITFFDSDKDYENFCKNNKGNENIKAMTSFYSNLLLNHCISSEYIAESIIFLINKIKETTNNVIIYELLENIKIYISITHTVISKNKEWDLIIKNIEYMKGKKNGFSHLKNKCVFKCMDILDILN